MGAAINRSLTLALQLEERGMGTLALSVQTSTVELVDSVETEGKVYTAHSRLFRLHNPFIDLYFIVC